MTLLSNPFFQAIILVILGVMAWRSKLVLSSILNGGAAKITLMDSFRAWQVARKEPGKFQVGFTLEMVKERVRESARQELAAKQLLLTQQKEQNLLVANSRVAEQYSSSASRVEQNSSFPRAAYDDEDTLNSSESFMAGLQSAGGWIESLVDAFHLLIIGGTRGGKTVLLHEIAERRAKTDDVYVIDCDSRPGLYPSAKMVVCGGDEFEEGDRLLAWFTEQIKERRQLRRQGQRRFQPITLAISELGATISGCALARDVFEEIVRRGAKLGIRIAVDVQDNQVKTLKLEGASSLLINLLKVEVRKSVDGRRTATIDGKEYLIPKLTDPEVLGDIEYERRKVSGVSGLDSMPDMRSNVHERSEAFNLTPHQDAIERVQLNVQSVQTSVQAPINPLNVNVQDAVALAKALTLKSNGATKQESIERAWSIKKGGGESWAKASALFDMAFDK